MVQERPGILVIIHFFLFRSHLGEIFKLLTPHYEIWGYRWPLGCTWNNVVINIGWGRVIASGPKLTLEQLNGWQKVWTNFTFCFSGFIAVFNKQANIRCSTGSISRPISSRDHNAIDQAIAMDRYQGYFRKLDNSFSEKQQGAVRTDYKILSSYLCFLHGGKDFQSSYITFDIFNNSTFFSTTGKTNENYKVW